MKIACNALGNPIKYNEIYPEHTNKSFDVKLSFHSAGSYLQEIEQLKKKGFLSGSPQFVLNASKKETSFVPELKAQGYAVKIYSDGEQVLEKDCSLCDCVVFRLYGFSQMTYSKVNQYKFGDVIQNISESVRILREKNPLLRCELVYVMYQFNFGQKYLAKQWAKKINADFHVRFAGFAEQNKKRDYLSGKMSTHEMITESKKFFFNYLDELVEEKERFFQQYQGREPILLNEKAQLESEWEMEENERISLSDIESYGEWRACNERVFSNAAEKPFSGLLWIWKRSGE